MSNLPDIDMDSRTNYEKYRPKMYYRQTPIFWWVDKGAYVWFITRELTSIFVAAYAIILLLQVRAIGQGPEAYDALMAFFTTPVSLVLHTVILLYVLFHSITWFNLAPSAMIMKIGKKQIPDSYIIALNLVMWIVLSLAVAWLILTA